MTACSCSLCLNGNYNPNDYVVELSSLDGERPNGVSGLMRVKNEELWVEASIDSCINALDELIICYQQCDDKTPEIVLRKQKQYPDKIKAYYYAPHTYAHNLSPQDFEYAYALPRNSIHLLSNYYNYTLSKATYKYAVKIDADQIYFTDRLTQLCNAYRSDKPRNPSFAERVAFWWFRKYLRAAEKQNIAFRMASAFPSLGECVYKKYRSYLCSQISRTKIPVSLSGINLRGDSKNWQICGMTKNNTFTPLYFNGTTDTLFFAVSQQTHYCPVFQTPEKNQVRDDISHNLFYTSHRIIERFVSPLTTIRHYGFMWYHMNFANAQQIEGHTVQSMMNLNTFRSASYQDMMRSNLHPEKIYLPHLFFHTYDQNYPHPSDTTLR